MHQTTDPKLQLLILFHEYERDGATAFLKLKINRFRGGLVNRLPYELRLPADGRRPCTQPVTDTPPDPQFSVVVRHDRCLTPVVTDFASVQCLINH